MPDNKDKKGPKSPPKQRRSKKKGPGSTRAAKGASSETKYPLHECIINADWEEDGVATIVLTRKMPSGDLTLAAFLVEVPGKGLRDAWGLIRTDVAEYRSIRRKFAKTCGVKNLDWQTARHMVFGGIQRVEEKELELPKRHKVWAAVLGRLPENVAPDMAPFQKDDAAADAAADAVDEGDEERLIRGALELLSGRLGKDIEPVDEDFLDDPESAEMTEIVDWFSRELVTHVRQWCFANGEIPSPMLSEAVDAAVEAMSQMGEFILFDDLSDADLSDEALDELETGFEMVQQFVMVCCEGREGMAMVALEQLHGFICSFESPAEFLQAVKPPEFVLDALAHGAGDDDYDDDDGEDNDDKDDGQGLLF